MLLKERYQRRIVTPWLDALRSILNGCYINIARIYVDDGNYQRAVDITVKGIKAGADIVVPDFSQGEKLLSVLFGGG